MSLTAYKPRRPQDSDYYHCVEDYFETFVQSYDEHFSKQYGFWRPYIEKVICRYLDCGDLHQGFARVKCKDCGHTLKGTREYLPAFSCKRRHFCPSCHQKRVVEFGEWLCMDVIKKVPHRHFIFGIPKILRRYFLYDRKLLSALSRCAWESLKVFMQQAVPEKEPISGAVIAIGNILFEAIRSVGKHAQQGIAAMSYGISFQETRPELIPLVSIDGNLFPQKRSRFSG